MNRKLTVMKAKILGIALITAISMGAANAHTSISASIKIGSKIKPHHGHSHGHHGRHNYSHSSNSRHSSHRYRYNNGYSNGYNHGYRHDHSYQHQKRPYNNHGYHARGKADLVIRRVRGKPRYSHRHGGYLVVVKVKNVGNKRSQATRVRIVEKRQGNNRANNHVPSLAPGESRRVRVVLPYQPRHRVKIRVNPRNRVLERNYSNNSWKGRV